MAINVGRETRRKSRSQCIWRNVPFSQYHIIFVCIGIWHFEWFCMLHAYDSQHTFTFSFMHNVKCELLLSNEVKLVFCPFSFFRFTFVVCVMFDRKVEVHKHDQRLDRKNGLVSRAVFSAAFYVLRRLDQTRKKKLGEKKTVGNISYVCRCTRSSIFLFVLSQAFDRLFEFDMFFFLFISFVIRPVRSAATLACFVCFSLFLRSLDRVRHAFTK